ncbi:flagellar filament capping protein FliD [Magnetococcus sp. PR-3]|uniref:flagellar filament capping protein FliD n=1 Tax=Magnetococcus sp. PR-3 TaxID=3120355 RepID=UPI002FCE21BF
MATGSITFGGLASGLPADIVDQMMQAENARLTKMTQERSSVSSSKSTYSSLESQLLSLKSKAEDMQDADFFRPHTATSSDEDVSTVTADSDAQEGNHAVTVTQLATYDTFVSPGVVTDTSAGLTADTTFTFDYNGDTYNVSLSSGDTLADIADAITNEEYTNEDDGEGVTASVLYDGTNYRLLLNAKDSGQNSGAARIDLTSAGNMVFDSGDTILGGETAADDDTGWWNSVAAQDASLTVDNIAVTSTSNVVDNVLSGIELTLKDTGTFTVTVANDEETLKTNVQTFVDSFNGVISFINNNKSQFSGDSLARNTIGMLRDEINTATHDSDSPFDELSTYSTLSSIGIKTDSSTGLLSIDSSDFSDAMDLGYNKIAEIFTSKPSSADESDFETAGASEGLSHRIEDLVYSLTTDTDNPYDAKSDSLQARLDSMANSIEREEYRLEKVRDRLSKQFASLEQLMSQMQATQSSLTSALSGL